jgi:bacteriophage N4 adsorption protein B
MISAAFLFSLWHVLLAEALLIVAALVAVNGLDDLAVDLAWLVMPRTARQPPPVAPVPAPLPTPLPTPLPAPLPALLPVFAILVPAWDESAVIGAMLRRLTATQRWPDYRVFVGLYPNDPAGIAAVAALDDPRITMVIGQNPGPTTKADCLNTLWRAAVAHEQASGRRFAAIVLHDAEDVVHSHELACFARHLPGHALVQLPVLPLADAGSPFIAGHYIDEFAEGHGKELPVRQWLGAAVPAAGVGVAIDRQMLGRIAALRGAAPFDAESLTEDYELGQHVHRLGGKALMLWLWADGEAVATAEHFPATWNGAVRQKARWLTGIALSGWDRLGWRGGLAQRWMLLRDRKAPLMALVTLAAYVLALLLGVDGLLRQHSAMAARLPPVASGFTLVLLWINWALLCWRLVVRAWFTGQLRGPVEGLLAPPRALVGNLINAAAALRALSRYRAALKAGHAPSWEKTLHRFPEAG